MDASIRVLQNNACDDRVRAEDSTQVQNGRSSTSRPSLCYAILQHVDVRCSSCIFDNRHSVRRRAPLSVISDLSILPFPKTVGETESLKVIAKNYQFGHFISVRVNIRRRNGTTVDHAPRLGFAPTRVTKIIKVVCGKFWKLQRKAIDLCFAQSCAVQCCDLFSSVTNKFSECEVKSPRKSQRLTEHFAAISCSSLMRFCLGIDQ
jgi:hypothetical protein